MGTVLWGGKIWQCGNVRSAVIQRNPDASPENAQSAEQAAFLKRQSDNKDELVISMH